MNFLLICGHGDGDSGAVSKIDGITRKEFKIVRNFAPLLKKALVNNGHSVTIYDTEKNVYKELCHNKNSVIFNGYDVVLELHCNSSNNKYYTSDNKTMGTEVFYPSTQANNVSVKTLAKDLCHAIANTSSLKERGAKSGKFLVINTASDKGVCNAFLIELFFLNDFDDIILYKKNKQNIANAIANCFKESYLVKIKNEYCHVYIDYKNKVKHSKKLYKGEVYTIVDEILCNGILYGKLKSGIGYIDLNCTERCKNGL